MTGNTILKLRLRSRVLKQDAAGFAHWRTVTSTKSVPASETAIIICDMWDNHWSRGAAERVDQMAPHMNKVLAAARTKGVHIVHAPSDTMDFYAGTPARERILKVSPVEPPPSLEHEDPPLPVDASDGGSDTGETKAYKAWTRQHPAIEIDQARDVVSANGREIYRYFQHKGITHALIMGVHTNMCVLDRSFAIKQMVKWSVPIALVRDLTDAMYNPAKPPYVSHLAGTRLIIEYIEKFWCPTISSEDLRG